MSPQNPTLGAEAPVTEPPWPRPSQAWIALCAFCVAAILSYTDRQILSLLVDPLRLAFRLSDSQVSLLQGVAFALIYAFAGLPLGRMADVLPRKRVIIGGILIWSLATLWCGLARSFGELFLARGLVGIGEAALAPAAASMIADYFPPRRRGVATGVFLMGQVAGGGLAITVGGAILQLAQSGALAHLPLIGALAPWRATLLVLALPGLLVALLMTATREPPRRHAPGRLAALPLGQVARALWAHRATLGPIYLGMALLSVGDFSLQNWFPTLLSRKFGLSPGLIGAELGPAAIAGAVIGAMGAGLLSDRRVGRGGVAARLPIATVAAALAVLGALVMFASSSVVAIAIFMGWLVMSNAAGAIGITAVQELAPPSVRGVALALISFFNIGIGLGVGTTMTALLTDKVFHGPGGVGDSMTTMALPAAVLGALAFLWASHGAKRAAGDSVSALRWTGPFRWTGLCLATAATLIALPVSGATVQDAPGQQKFDVVIRDGEVYDGSGKAPVVADVGVVGDRVTAIAPRLAGRGRIEIDARGKAVAPGFINMLAHPEETLIADGRALSDLKQGVTLEVLGEDSMGPLNPTMKALAARRQGDIKYPVTWTTLGEYLEMLERKGISPNVASFVGASTVRINVLGEADVQPTPVQLAEMQGLVRQAMEEGALGLTDALMYAPDSYARTPEVAALAQVSARCGGIYIAHIRSEGDHLQQALRETFDIAEASGAPAEIYHLKEAGRDNWGKLDKVVAMIDAERAKGVRITADMYTYTAAATGLDAAMPPWVQSGGIEQWIARLKDPAIRARVAAEMREPHPQGWESYYAGAGPEQTLLLAFKTPALKPLTGKTLAQVARMRGKSPEETAMDLVVEDGSRVAVAYFLMSEDNVRRQVALPWMSFGSDESAPAPEGVFLLSHVHPRAYGNFARLLGHYVRETHDLSLTEAVRRLTSLPADNLSLKDRGRLAPGDFADIVVFDPATISDHATYDNPAQLATGVDQVLVNGRFALRDGLPTGAATGRIVRGRAWSGGTGGGCKAASGDWSWSK